MHHHRAEHWIVVKGTARVSCNDKEYLLSENESYSLGYRFDELILDLCKCH